MARSVACRWGFSVSALGLSLRGPLVHDSVSSSAGGRQSGPRASSPAGGSWPQSSCSSELCSLLGEGAVTRGSPLLLKALRIAVFSAADPGTGRAPCPGPRRVSRRLRSGQDACPCFPGHLSQHPAPALWLPLGPSHTRKEEEERTWASSMRDKSSRFVSFKNNWQSRDYKTHVMPQLGPGNQEAQQAKTEGLCKIVDFSQ